MISSWLRRVHLRFFVYAYVAAMLLPAMPLVAQALTASTAPWMTTPIQTEEIPGMPAAYRMDNSIGYNRDCVPRQVITSSFSLFSGSTLNTSCAVDTLYGAYTRTGYLQRPGTELYGQVRIGDINGSVANVVPLPHSPVVMLASGLSTYGSYYRMMPSGSAVITSTSLADGTVRHVLPAGGGTVLADASGTPVDLRYDTIAVSSNGSWMIADSPSIGMTRISLSGGQYSVLPFGSKYPYSSADVASRYTAISNDGRYAVVAVNDKVTLFDLDTCDTPPAHPTGPVTCQSANLVPAIKQAAPAFLGASMVRFTSENSLTLYATQMGDQPGQPKHYMLYTGTKPASQLTYLAMGDSFASGEGAYSYKSVTDANGNYCHVSQLSYPYLIAAGIDLGRSENVACSGAVVNNILPLDENNVAIKPQVKDMDMPEYDNMIYNGYLPGYRQQIEFTRRGLPEIITLSVGGNDIGFSDIIKRCILSTDTCYNFYEDRAELLTSINLKFNSLVETYNQVKQASPSSRIYIIGYPSIVAENGNCAANVLLNNDEIVFANQLTTYLNDVIRRATENAGVRYVDVSTALHGHRLCEAPSAEVAVNGLTAGNDTWRALGGPIGNESYHPNALGHELLAAKIRQQTSDFAQSMPQPNSAMFPPAVTSTVPILQVSRQNRAMTPIYYVPFAGQFLAKSIEQGFKLQNATPLSTSPAEIWLNSTPVKIGVLGANQDGTVDTTVNIPANIEPGYHTVHIYGKDISGQNIDIQSIVYVAESANDLNGNGTPNEQDPCPAFATSQQDDDRDGIDDTCDGAIVQTDTTAPIVTASVANSPNQNGWYNENVNINWTSTDDSPNGPQQLPPPPTSIADIEGEHTYSSQPSCDAAGNCTQGSHTIKLDITQPTISYSVDITPNENGWYAKPPTITFHCQDTLSGVDTCPEPRTIQNEDTTTIQESAKDAAGNVRDIEVQVALDTTLPQIDSRVSPMPGENGWYTQAVQISYTCSDELSGIASCPTDQLINEDTGGREIRATSADAAGNIQVHTQQVRLDATKPRISYTLSAQPNERGWHTSPVTVTFKCEDETSGVATCSTPQTLSQDGVYIVTGSAQDAAGNISEVNIIVAIDTTRPTVQIIPEQTANMHGWYRQAVTIHAVCSDDTAGILTCGNGDDITIDQPGINQTVTVHAIDNAGNTSSDTISINVDFTSPELGDPLWSNQTKPVDAYATVSVPMSDDASGVQAAEYYIGDNDPGAGNGAPMVLAGQQAQVTFGSDFPVGVYAIHIRALDRAGNWSPDIVTYLTVFQTSATGVHAEGRLALTTKNSSQLPWVTKGDDQHAQFALSVKQDKNARISQTSDFQFSYTAKERCSNHKKSDSCHSFRLDASSIDQVIFSGSHQEISTIQGTALLLIDGRPQTVTFRVICTDGSKLGKKVKDTVALEIFQKDVTPGSAKPRYDIQSTSLLKGSVTIRNTAQH